MAKTLAERQAAHREKLKSEGKTQRLITVSEVDWQAGFEKGLSGGSEYPVPPEVTDRLAWFSGVLEGKAKRERK